MRKFIIFFITCLFYSSLLSAQEADDALRDYIKEFNYSAIEEKPQRVEPLFVLGRQLFHSNSLSLAGDISCASCHSEARGTADGLPFGIGTGGVGTTPTRMQGQAGATKRNSPALWNLGARKDVPLFWDGRVHFRRLDNGNAQVISPSRFLSGVKPILMDVFLMLESSAAAQALFPLISKVEMLGGDYPDMEDDKLWELITESALNDPANDMRTLFQLAYPGVEDFHIGHIAKALAHFQEDMFFVNDTPWDDYLRGDVHALSEQEKRGALVFMEQGRCAECHSGQHFSSTEFENILIPDLGVKKAPVDLGRYEVTQEPKDKYAFMVSPLRNISLTAPYMHNGALLTLEEVIDHYDHPMRVFRHMTPTRLNDVYGRFYNAPIVRDFSMDQLRDQFSTKSDKLQMNLSLSQKQKEDLLVFLKESLTSRRWARD